MHAVHMRPFTCGRGPHELPYTRCHLFMTGLRQMDRIKRGSVGSEDGQQDALGYEQHAVLVRERALNSTVFVAERWKRQFKHNDLSIRRGYVSEKCIEVTRELIG